MVNLQKTKKRRKNFKLKKKGGGKTEKTKRTSTAKKRYSSKFKKDDKTEKINLPGDFANQLSQRLNSLQEAQATQSLQNLSLDLSEGDKISQKSPPSTPKNTKQSSIGFSELGTPSELPFSELGSPHSNKYGDSSDKSKDYDDSSLDSHKTARSRSPSKPRPGSPI